MRERVPTNVIGERISLKVQNVLPLNFQIEDIGINIINMGCRKSEKINNVAQHLSYKIQNSGVLPYEYLTDEDGTDLSDEDDVEIIAIEGDPQGFAVEYIKFVGEAYEGQ
jgi:hypothetical protein